MTCQLSDVYRDYVDCLNRQDWVNLGQFVDVKCSTTERGWDWRVIGRC